MATNVLRDKDRDTVDRLMITASNYADACEQLGYADTKACCDKAQRLQIQLRTEMTQAFKSRGFVQLYLESENIPYIESADGKVFTLYPGKDNETTITSIYEAVNFVKLKSDK